MIRDQQEIFDNIYDKERWGKGLGSGTGSTPAYSRGWLDYVTKRVPFDAPVLDVGCGDMQLYETTPLWKHYTGIDISPIAISMAKVRRPTTRLEVVSSLRETVEFVLSERPHYVLLKDVMMHWTNAEIHFFLSYVCESEDAPVIITANNWRYVRKPSMNGQPRELDRYSWAPVPVDHPSLVQFGFKIVTYYPAGKFKVIMEKS